MGLPEKQEKWGERVKLTKGVFVVFMGLVHVWLSSPILIVRVRQIMKPRERK